MKKPFVWTAKDMDFLRENYPKKGKMWCAQELGLKEHQVRYKASVMGLVARGQSEAWKAKQKDHAIKLTGRKRPEQADVMRKCVVEKGLHLQSQEQLKINGEKTKKRIIENGHPKGMLGKKHSEQPKEKMSLSGRKRVIKEGTEGIESRTIKGMMTRSKNGTMVNQRPNASWKAGWREIGGIQKYYRSRWEANYARYLEWLKTNGEILKWDHEPETFWFDGIKRGCVSYLPDFRVIEKNGSVVYHEVKGWMDDRSITKIKRMAKYHPEIKLIVIDSKIYKSIAAKAKLFVNGWE